MLKALAAPLRYPLFLLLIFHSSLELLLHHRVYSKVREQVRGISVLLAGRGGNWRASKASETLLFVVQWKTRYVYTYYKYSILPRGISINIAPKVGIFPEAEGRGKYSIPRVQYYRYSTRKG